MNVAKIYEYALQREHEGKSFFETNADRMSHAAASDIFRRLAAEEQKHIEFIESLLVPQVMLYGFLGFEPGVEGFRLAPRLNAAGRMGHARLAVELLYASGPVGSGRGPSDPDPGQGLGFRVRESSSVVGSGTDGYDPQFERQQ